MDRFWKLRRSILEPSGFDFGESGVLMDRFWKLRRSILEPSGFDFGESGSHFRMFWASLMQPRTPRNARNLPNNNSITNGWIAKCSWCLDGTPRSRLERQNWPSSKKGGETYHHVMRFNEKTPYIAICCKPNFCKKKRGLINGGALALTT